MICGTFKEHLLTEAIRRNSRSGKLYHLEPISCIEEAVSMTDSDKSRTAEDDLTEFEPEQSIDFLWRTVINSRTGTKYLCYRLDGGINEDGTRESELFEGVPSHHKYVVCLPDCGEWKSFKTRSEITQQREGTARPGALYPWAMWSKHETARMATYDAVKLMTLACSKALPENCEDEIAVLRPIDIERAALMLLGIEEERRDEAEHYRDLSEEFVIEEEEE